MTVPLNWITSQLFFDHLHRWRRARRLGLSFRRRADFHLPVRVRINNQDIALDLLDEGGTRADFIGIFLDNMYMIERIKELRTIIDVGANQGLFSIYARSLFPQATIHAYEPNPALADRLAGHCRAINARVFIEAVGEFDGFCVLEVIGDSNLTRAHTIDRGEIAVTAISRAMDRIGSEVDLLKLDCEGFEWDILRATDALQRVRYLAMEYHCWANGSRHADMEPLLDKLGFTLLRQVESTDFGQILACRRDLGSA